jgi:hypothetical protein
MNGAEIGIKGGMRWEEMIVVSTHCLFSFGGHTYIIHTNRKFGNKRINVVF